MNRLLGIGAVAAVVVGFLSFKKVDFKLAAEDSNIVVTDRHTGKRWKVVGQKNEGTPLWSKATLTGNVRQNAATYTFGDYGAGWYDRLLKGERQPRHQPPPKLTEEELWTEIWELYVGLYDSPENLYEDGEASPSRVKEKIATFKRKIRMAGKELGRKVSYEQANDWARKNNIGWYGNAEDDNFKLAAEGETDVEQTLSMLGLTVAEVVEQNIAYKSKKPYGTASVIMDKSTGELSTRYGKGESGPDVFSHSHYHNSYGAYTSQLKRFNQWVGRIDRKARGGPDMVSIFVVSLLINRETGEVLRSHQGVESKNAESKKLPPLEKAEITGIASGATMEGLETLLAAEEKKEPVPKFPLSQKDIDYFTKELAFLGGASVRFKGKRYTSMSKFFGNAFEKPIFGRDKKGNKVTMWINKAHPFYPIYAQWDMRLLEHKICKKCGQKGHSANSKKCPQYASKPSVTPSSKIKKPLRKINPAYEIWSRKEDERERWEESLENIISRLNGLEHLWNSWSMERLNIAYRDGKIEQDILEKGPYDGGDENPPLKEQIEKILSQHPDTIAYLGITAREDTGGISVAHLDKLTPTIAPKTFLAESFSAEEPSVYYWVKEEMVKRLPLTDADIDNLLEMIRKSVPLPEIEEGMNQARNLGDEAIWFILSMAQTTRSGDLTIQERFVERYQADFPTTKKPNCKCGAILEWDNLRKAWYCISCPFNTYKAEMDEKAIICPHCEDAEATEICEWCKGKECKECFEEHMTDCNYCEGEGEIPRSWVSDSGDRWSPPSLDVTDWEMCEYCNEGQVCGDEYIPEFSWDAESFSAEVFETLLAAESIRWDRGHRAKSEDYWLYHGFNQDNFSATEVGLGDWCGRKLYYTGHQLKHYLCDCNALAGFHHPTEVVLSANNPKRLPEPQSPKMVEYGPLFVDEFMVESESFEAAKPSKWAGWCPKCNKWRTKQMSYAPDPYYVSRRADPDSLPTGVMLCAKKVRRGGYWKDEEGIPHKCDTPLSKKQGGAGGDVPYNPPPFNPDARRLQMAESFSAAEGERCYKCKTTQGKMYWHGKKGLICAICSEGGVKYRAESFSAEQGNEIVGFCENEGGVCFNNVRTYVCDKCNHCYRGCEDRDGDTPDMGCKCLYAESFSAESDGDKQLDESKKRTKMSAIRTGLAITTFSIVMWNLWTNKKQQKDIADIMALV